MYSFSADKETSESFTHKILKDDQDFIWLSSNNGLFRYKLEDLEKYIKSNNYLFHYQFFDKTNGFATNEFNGGVNSCGLITSTGMVVFPSVKGLVYFDPDRITHDVGKRKIAIDLFINGVHSHFTKWVEVNHSNRIILKIATPNYEHASNVKLLYRIKGTHEEWQGVPANNEISFPFLKSGTMDIEIIRLGINGIVGAESIVFFVSERWFELWWVKIIYVLLLFFIVFIIFRVRIVYLKKAEKKLKETVKEQYRILLDQNDQLEDYVEKLEMSEKSLSKQILVRQRLMGIISHDVIGPLHSIRHITKELDNGKTILDKKDGRDYLVNLHMAADSAYNTMHKILDWIKLQKEELVLEYEKVSLNKLLNEINKYFTLSTMMNKVEISYDQNEDFLITTDKQILSAILRNLIENEVKHNENITIYISWHKKGSKTIIEIRNPVSNFVDVDQLNILLNSSDIKSLKALNMEGGLGLILIKELSEIIKIKVQVLPLKDKGHEVILEW